MKITTKNHKCYFYDAILLGTKKTTYNMTMFFTKFGVCSEGTYVVNDIPEGDMRRCLENVVWAYGPKLTELYDFVCSNGSEKAFLEFRKTATQQATFSLLSWLAPVDFEELVFGPDDEISIGLECQPMIIDYLVYLEKAQLRSAAEITNTNVRQLQKI